MQHFEPYVPQSWFSWLHGSQLPLRLRSSEKADSESPVFPSTSHGESTKDFPYHCYREHLFNLFNNTVVYVIHIRTTDCHTLLGHSGWPASFTESRKPVSFASRSEHRDRRLNCLLYVLWPCKLIIYQLQQKSCILHHFFHNRVLHLSNSPNRIGTPK